VVSDGWYIDPITGQPVKLPLPPTLTGNKCYQWVYVPPGPGLWQEIPCAVPV